MSKITVGCDPELFLFRQGHPVSPHKLVPGTKEAPYKVKCGAVQLDGLAVEFNIDPAETADEFATNVDTVLSEVRRLIPNTYAMRFYPAVHFQPYEFNTAPDKCKELGCNPDYNAYTGLINENPNIAMSRDPYMRTGAGHIHIGWTKDEDKTDPGHMWDCCQVVKMLDEFYLHVKPQFDMDHQREKLYGAKGAFRPTTFGVEYRVPSNAWVRYPDLYPFIFTLAKATVEGMMSGEYHIPKFDKKWIARSL